jgi:CubicO group peptidase (beta-lactamase class C family)
MPDPIEHAKELSLERDSVETAEPAAPIGRRAFVTTAGRAALGLSVLPLASCSRPPHQSPTSLQGRSANALLADLEKRIPQLMREGNVPGVSIAIIRDAKLVWRRGFGVKDIATNEPVDNDTVFEAASTSKPVFAYAVMKLCERGVMDLDTPLTKYTSRRYLEGDPRLNLITARHVLSHTSGFQNFRTTNEPLSIHFTPGEQWSYSGEGYSYLQSVVTELVGGHVNPNDCGRYEADVEVCAMEPSIDAYMKANVLVPFGMTSSGYFWNGTIEKHMARGHLPDGKRSEVTRKPSGTDVARYGMVGGLCTTPTDYAKFLIELIDPKPSDAFRLNEKSRAEMLRPQIRCTPWSHWALGWEVEHTETGDVIRHGGGNPGYSCIVVASIEHKTGYAIMTNAEDIGYFNVIAKLISTEPLASLLGNRLTTNST